MTRRLDDIDTRLPAGSGSVTAAATIMNGAARFGVDYEQRIRQNVSAFASGWAAVNRSSGRWSPEYGATAGVRWTF